MANINLDELRIIRDALSLLYDDYEDRELKFRGTEVGDRAEKRMKEVKDLFYKVDEFIKSKEKIL